MRSALSLTLALLVGLPSGSPLAAQRQRPAPAKLNIVVVEGEGAINNVRRRVEREPVVRVEDENKRPVVAATVVFALPDSGPGGAFANGSRSYLARTDREGLAVAKGLRANDLQGKYEIRVQVSFRGASATAAINQANAVLPASGGGARKVIAILAAIGAAAATGAVIASRRGSAGSGPITITAGTPTVGGPQ